MITSLGRQALHALTLGFIHPASGEYLEFSTPLPEDLQTLCDYLSGLSPAINPPDKQDSVTCQ
jgi:23S rRNA pseudouridine1911/1915/1917 synthase